MTLTLEREAGMVVSGDIEDLEIGNLRGNQAMIMMPESDTLVVMLEATDTDGLFVAMLVTAPGELHQYQATFEAVLATLQIDAES